MRSWSCWQKSSKLGYRGGKATFYRWLASYRGRPVRTPPAILSKSDHRVPSRRTCTWLLGQNPDELDEASQRFHHHLFENTPKLQIASELARRLAAVLRGDDEVALDQWIIDSMGTELDSLAKGIRRDVGAVKAAIRHSWSTSPVELDANCYGAGSLHVGLIDLRPERTGLDDPEIRRLMVGRLQHLETMGLASSSAPGE